MLARQVFSQFSSALARCSTRPSYINLSVNICRKSTMATASHVKLTPSTAGIYHTPDITSQSAKVANELLQENHDKYHIFVNTDGFHNHIAHHLLAIYALGATPDELQKAYDNNKGYQRNQFPVKKNMCKTCLIRRSLRYSSEKSNIFAIMKSSFRKRSMRRDGKKC
jgi:sulfur relay (sulfurtransferase) complex TusBCD TusD component (DsrE family)